MLSHVYNSHCISSGEGSPRTGVGDCCISAASWKESFMRKHPHSSSVAEAVALPCQMPAELSSSRPYGPRAPGTHCVAVQGKLFIDLNSRVAFVKDEDRIGTI